MDLLVIGVNHKTAPADVRDQIHLGADEMGTLYAHTNEFREVIPELAILSTCNRTEFYALTRDIDAADHALRDAMYFHKGVQHLNNGKVTYTLRNREAVKNLFRVATGVDSLMIGEPQILGQVKEAFDLAERHRAAGALLTRLFNTAVHVGKRARSETGIGKGTVSVAFAAVEMAQGIFGSLRNKAVLVIGAGETGALAARHFSDADPGSLTIVNRTKEKAEALAHRLGGRAVAWDEMDSVLAEARVIVTATGATRTILNRDRMDGALQESGEGSKVLVDISNPRNIEPEVGDLDGVFLYDLDALTRVAEKNRNRRQDEIPKVEVIVAEEVDRFLAWYDSLEMVPVIKALRGRFEEIAGKEIQKRAKNFHPSDQEALQEYTRALLNKLLHQPTTRIRNVEPSSTHGLRKLVAIQELFELDLEPYTEEEAGAAPPEVDPEEAENQGEEKGGS